MRRALILTAAGAMLVTGFVVFGTVGLVNAEDIKVGGGGAAMATIFQPVKPQFEKATSITVINLQSSPQDGLADLLEDVQASAGDPAFLENGMGVAAGGDGILFGVADHRHQLAIHPNQDFPFHTHGELVGVGEHHPTFSGGVCH